MMNPKKLEYLVGKRPGFKHTCTPLSLGDASFCTSPGFFLPDQTNPREHTSTSSRLDQLHARVERFFFADIQKLRRFFGGANFGG